MGRFLGIAQNHRLISSTIILPITLWALCRQCSCSLAIARAAIFYWFNSLILLQVASCNQKSGKISLFQIPTLVLFRFWSRSRNFNFSSIMFYCRIDYAAIAVVEETKLYGFHAEFTVLITWEIKLFSSIIMLAKYIVFLITY